MKSAEFTSLVCRTSYCEQVPEITCERYPFIYFMFLLQSLFVSENWFITISIILAEFANFFLFIYGNFIVV